MMWNVDLADPDRHLLEPEQLAWLEKELDA